MSDPINLIEELVCDDRFCKYVLNPDRETLKYWETFRKNNPDKEEAIIQARQLVLLLGDDKDVYDPEIDKRAEVLWEKVHTEIRKKTSGSNRSNRNSFTGYVLKIAAVLFLLGIISFILLDLSPETGKKHYYSSRNYFHRAAQIGQKVSFFLPDGTHVNLNSGSSLYYYENLETSTREVTLEGEAFLNVKKDKARPFIVQTKHLSARVLGTSFNVKAYPNEVNTKIALVTGKLKVTSEKLSPHVLSPNQMAVFDQSDLSTEIKSFDPEKIICWKDNVLLFDEVGLKEIITILGRWYGVEFVISGPLKGNKELFDQKDYKGKYKDKSLETVLEAISFSYGFDFSIQDNKVLIK
ncbi:MAG: FecR domain-containing protein [Cyclobacteriaceae bacterium]